MLVSGRQLRSEHAESSSVANGSWLPHRKCPPSMSHDQSPMEPWPSIYHANGRCTSVQQNTHCAHTETGSAVVYIKSINCCDKLYGHQRDMARDMRAPRHYAISYKCTRNCAVVFFSAAFRTHGARFDANLACGMRARSRVHETRHAARSCRGIHAQCAAPRRRCPCD